MKCSKWHHIDLSNHAQYTVVFEGGFALTGRILDRNEMQEESDIQEESKNREESDRHEEAQFFWLKLKCPFCASGVAYFPEGTFVAVNVNQVLFIGPSYDCPPNNM